MQPAHSHALYFSVFVQVLALGIFSMQPGPGTLEQNLIFRGAILLYQILNQLLKIMNLGKKN